MGFVIQKHYCNNELRDVSFLFKSDTCDMLSAMKAPCPMHAEHRSPQNEEQSSHENDCCKDTVEVLKPVQDLQAKIALSQLELDPVFIGIVAMVLKLVIPKKNKLSHPYQHYKPPILVYDLSLSLQTFLC